MVSFTWEKEEVSFPNNRGKEVNLCVFTASHCHQLRSHGWAEIVVEFISPQQDILSPEILFGEYINCKFEEIKMKSVKRSKSCHYVDDLSAVL